MLKRGLVIFVLILMLFLSVQSTLACDYDEILCSVGCYPPGNYDTIDCEVKTTRNVDLGYPSQTGNVWTFKSFTLNENVKLHFRNGQAQMSSFVLGTANFLGGDGGTGGNSPKGGDGGRGGQGAVAGYKGTTGGDGKPGTGCTSCWTTGCSCHGVGGDGGIPNFAGAFVKIHVLEDFTLKSNSNLSLSAGLGDKGDDGGKGCRGGGAGGGSGGAGAGVLTLNVSGSVIFEQDSHISAKGGTGGTGGHGGNDCQGSGNYGGAGGGGGTGGNGGKINIFYQTIVDQSNLNCDVSAGIKGQPGTGSDNGGTGVAGVDGESGDCSNIVQKTERLNLSNGLMVDAWCNDGSDNDNDGKTDMQDEDCWHLPADTIPGICNQNAGPILDFINLPLGDAIAYNGRDGCCGDDNSTSILEDLYFIYSSKRFFCSKDWDNVADGFDNIIPVAATSFWKWWDAKQHKFLIHKVTI